MPDANYDIVRDWTKGATKSNFSKEFRHTIATEAERLTKKFTIPEPPTYNIKHNLVEPKSKGVYNLKANRDDTSFLATPMYNGSISPRYHDKKHHLVEKRVMALAYKKPINEKLDKIPAFLRAKHATHLISPASHNPLESLKSAVLPKQTFYNRRGSPKSHLEMEIKRTQGNPGIGTYSLKNIENAYNKITMGMSRGWK